MLIEKPEIKKIEIKSMFSLYAVKRKTSATNLLLDTHLVGNTVDNTLSFLVIINFKLYLNFLLELIIRKLIQNPFTYKCKGVKTVVLPDFLFFFARYN